MSLTAYGADPPDVLKAKASGVAAQGAGSGQGRAGFSVQRLGFRV